MALESKTRIRLRHTFAIINHLDRSTSCIHYRDINMMCPRIYGILNQFLDDTGRTLNDLSCSYLISNRIGKKLDNIRHNTNI